MEEQYGSRTDAIIEALDDYVYSFGLERCREALEEQDSDEFLEWAEPVYSRDRELGERLAKTYVTLEEIGYWKD